MLHTNLYTYIHYRYLLCEPSEPLVVKDKTQLYWRSKNVFFFRKSIITLHFLFYNLQFLVFMRKILTIVDSVA